MRTACIKILLLLTATVLSVPLHAQKMVFAAPDKNNQKVVKRYNCYSHNWGYPDMGGRAVGYTAVFGVKQNSIMSTDDVEVNVVKRWVQDAAVNDLENRMYFIEIKNKSDKTLYIDKSHCYRIYHDGTRYCYYDPERDDTAMCETLDMGDKKRAERFDELRKKYPKRLEFSHGVVKNAGANEKNILKAWGFEVSYD